MMENNDKCNNCIPSDMPEAPAFDYVNTPSARSARAAGLLNLAELAGGESGLVDRLSETDHDLPHLVNEGHNPEFLPGLEVTVMAKSPNNGPVLIKANGMIYDICNDVASVVWVKRC